MKRSILNIIIGTLSQIIIIALAFFIPRLIIVTYGSETNGLVTSVMQVITYLSLLEAGVGAASIQALYKPIGSNDLSKVNEILTATASYYRKTGLYYFIAVIVISILYPIVVQSEYDVLTVMGIVLLSGMGGVLNYYFQGKFRVLLLAEGKNYIVGSVTAATTIVNSLIRIALMLNGFDIIFVQAVFFLITVLQIIIYQIYIRKNYNWIDFKKNIPDFAAISQKGSVLIHEVSFIVFKNTDIVLLTIFADLKMVSIYMMYNLVFSVAESVIFTLRDSFKFALGQTFSNNRPKFLKLFNLFESSYITIVFCLLTITAILILPFMKLYTSGIYDVNYIDYQLPLFFVLVKVLFNARLASDLLVDIAGHFKKTQNRSIIETVINVVLSLILVVPFGVYGVLLSTAIALTYRFIDLTWYINKKFLNRHPWNTYKIWVVNLVLSVVIFISSNQIPFFSGYINTYLKFVLSASVLAFIAVPLYFSITLWANRESAATLRELIKPAGAKLKLRRLEQRRQKHV